MGGVDCPEVHGLFEAKERGRKRWEGAEREIWREDERR